METKKSGKIEKVIKGRFMISAAASSLAEPAAADSGDAAVCCGLPDGSLAFILSDGMGKGIKAAAESQRVINRLRKMLKAGVPVARAIKLLNRYMVEKSDGDENFATVDLTIIDKSTGKAKFYKMGAATSYIVRNGNVRRVQRPALPVGIVSTVRLSHISVELDPGDTVIMVSDGITEADRKDLAGRWLENFLEENCHAERGPRAIAESIASAAKSKYGMRERDDLTAVVAIIE